MAPSTEICSYCNAPVGPDPGDWCWFHDGPIDEGKVDEGLSKDEAAAWAALVAEHGAPVGVPEDRS